MIQVITATYEDGVLKPHAELDLPARSTVRVAVEPLDETPAVLRREAWEAVEQLWRTSSLDSRGDRLTRDQLHERR